MVLYLDQIRTKLELLHQFYFAEKEENDGTKFYSLADLKGIRNDADFAKHYLAGFYGGVPILSKYLNEQNIEEDGALGN